MKKLWKKLTIGFSLLVLLFSAPACEEVAQVIVWLGEQYISSLGWQAETENMDELEADINLSDADDLPSSVDLGQYFPPIGNQGSYGTCVAWSVGYNLRSYLAAYDGGYTPNYSSQQYSPKDLFWAIPNSQKGADCNGTQFEHAFDIMVSRGIAPLNDVPYNDLQDCSQSPPSSWNSAANQHKIKSYRKIAIDETTIKAYLAQGRAVAFGAKLGDNFMSGNNGQILRSDTYGYSGQHAYHAMILSGYDDSKQAFKVVNSWGNSWGSSGYIWVDYDFFVNEFCFAAFVASTFEHTDPDPDDDNQADDLADGKDLVAWELIDEWDPRWDDPLDRKITYNVFNSGDETIYAASRWNILYLYYNAYDPQNDWGILLYDYYTDEYGVAGNYWFGNDGNYGNLDEGPGQTNYWNNVNVLPGESVAYALFHQGTDDRFLGYYGMPSYLTGSYYLVLIADGYDDLRETNEENNYFYANNEQPVSIVNGVIQGNIAKKALADNVVPPKKYAPSPAQSATEEDLNTYSTEEISALIKHQLQRGLIEQKVSEFVKSNKKRQKAPYKK